MEGSVRVNGRLFGVTYQRPAPTAAMALDTIRTMRQGMGVRRGLTLRLSSRGCRRRRGASIFVSWLRSVGMMLCSQDGFSLWKSGWDE